MYSDLCIQGSSSNKEMKPAKLSGAEINWVEKGVVAPVQDQGQCGASWAFSAVGAIESAHMISGSGYLKLSEQ